MVEYLDMKLPRLLLSSLKHWRIFLPFRTSSTSVYPWSFLVDPLKLRAGARRLLSKLHGKNFNLDCAILPMGTSLDIARIIISSTQDHVTIIILLRIIPSGELMTCFDDIIAKNTNMKTKKCIADDKDCDWYSWMIAYDFTLDYHDAVALSACVDILAKKIMDTFPGASLLALTYQFYYEDVAWAREGLKYQRLYSLSVMPEIISYNEYHDRIREVFDEYDPVKPVCVIARLYLYDNHDKEDAVAICIINEKRRELVFIPRGMRKMDMAHILENARKGLDCFGTKSGFAPCEGYSGVDVLDFTSLDVRFATVEKVMSNILDGIPCESVDFQASVESFSFNDGDDLKPIIESVDSLCAGWVKCKEKFNLKDAKD